MDRAKGGRVDVKKRDDNFGEGLNFQRGSRVENLNWPVKNGVSDFEKTVSSIPLSTQLASIFAEVEIPDKEFLVLTNLTERIRKIAGGRDPKVAYTTIFRHNYLKLRNAGSNQVLIYMSKFQHHPLLFNRRQIEKLFEGSQLTPLRAGSEEMEAGYPYFDEQSRLKISLVTDPHDQTEVVTCQLAKYLFKFDPRAKSLVTLVHYWARENSVTLADKNSNVPDPAALEWLVLFFLGRKGLIPTLQVLLNRASRKKDPFFEGNKKINVAFPPDIKFIGEWREENMKNIGAQRSDEYVLEMLRLILEFFEFFSNEDLKGNVLNTRNGDIIPALTAIKEGLVGCSFTASSYIDRGSFQVLREKSLAMETKLKKEIYLMQPFRKCRFDVCQEKFETLVRPRMKTTARKLKLFLEPQRKPMGGATGFLKSLFDCGKEALCDDKLQTGNNCQPGLDFETRANLERDVIGLSETLECNQTEPKERTNPTSLSQLFQALNDDLAIQAEEWEVLFELQKKLKYFFELHGFPNCELVLFRNRHLKLHPVGSDTSIYLFLDHSGLYSNECDGTRRVLTSNWILLEDITLLKKSDVTSEQTKRLLLATVEPEDATAQQIPLLSFEKLNFRIATRSFLPEVQTCRLAEYFCTFDRRVKPLMSIVFYWAKLNNIWLGREDQEKVSIAPGPALLEWLVIFFLCQKKILPPPCEISGRNADESLIFDGINIGVKRDLKYARDWCHRYAETDEEKHFFNVFELAQEFFLFWGQLGLKASMEPIIINLKTGTYFEKEYVHKNSENLRRLSWATGISHQDLELLHSEPKMREGFYARDEAVTILHPLHIMYGFSFCCKSFLLSVCPKIGVTGVNLKKTLESYMSRGIEFEFSLQNMFKAN